jgi:hypothetical protein
VVFPTPPLPPTAIFKLIYKSLINYELLIIINIKGSSPFLTFYD